VRRVRESQFQAAVVAIVAVVVSTRYKCCCYDSMACEVVEAFVTSQMIWIFSTYIYLAWLSSCDSSIPYQKVPKLQLFIAIF